MQLFNPTVNYQQPNEEGYYGDYGGAYIPEMLYGNVEELKNKYLEIMKDPGFQAEFHALLKDYVGRPTPLFLAERLSKEIGATIYLKREDLCHTGAHKINNTIGQILLAQRLGKTKIIAETGAGQHGVATATVCALKGLECVVYMGEKDIERQAPNVARMKLLGAKVVPVLSVPFSSFWSLCPVLPFCVFSGLAKFSVPFLISLVFVCCLSLLFFSVFSFCLFVMFSLVFLFCVSLLLFWSFCSDFFVFFLAFLFCLFFLFSLVFVSCLTLLCLFRSF